MSTTPNPPKPSPVASLASAKHALKTAIAAGLTLLGYRILGLSDLANEAWAVVSAVIVMQSNVGSSLKASWSRLQGTAIGALVAAAVAAMLGHGVLGLSLAIAGTVIICARLGLQDSLRLAGATVVVVMLSNPGANPWAVGLERYGDTAAGIAMALLTQLLIWPARAGRELRIGLAQHIDECAGFFRVAAEGALHGPYPREAIEAQRELLRQSLAKTRELLRDLESEPGRRAEEEKLATLLSLTGDLRHHILALEAAGRDMGDDQYFRHLGQQLTGLTTAVSEALVWLAMVLRRESPLPPVPNLQGPLDAADAEYARLRAAGAGKSYSTDEILRYCSYFFSLRSAARTAAVMMPLCKAEDALT